jgi:hypothetical protein
MKKSWMLAAIFSFLCLANPYLDLHCSSAYSAHDMFRGRPRREVVRSANLREYRRNSRDSRREAAAGVHHDL